MRYLSFVFLACCGYSLSQAERAPNGMRRFYVNQAMDAGTDVGPGATLTRILRQRVAGSNAASLVALNEAEGVLEARIDRIMDAASVAAGPVNPNGTSVSVPSFIVRMSGMLRLIDGNGGVVWQSGPMEVEETYLTGETGGNTPAAVLDSLVPVTESNRRRALERGAERLANELYTRLMEGF